jgi:hypothetical protein
MRLGDRSSTILLAVITIILALAVGLVIPLAAGNSLGGRPQPWTPPPSPTPTSVPPTATALPNAGAKPTAPTATRALPTPTRPPVVTPSLTPRATEPLTATVAPPSAAVIAPTATVTPGAAAAAQRAQVREGPLSLRAGPNLSQPAISSAQVGQAFTVTGRTADNAWLQVCCVNNEPAWLASQFVVVTGTLTTLPVKP